MGYDSVGKEEFRALVKRVEALEDKLAEVKKPFLAAINQPDAVAAVVITKEEAINAAVDAVVAEAKKKPSFVERMLRISDAVEPIQAEEKEPG